MKVLSPRSEPLRVGVVGAGAMGTNHARVLSWLREVELVGVHDLVLARAERVASEFGTRAWAELAPLAAAVEALVLAVPTAAHAEVGCGLLERGVHLLVEKPIAASLADADALIAAAGDRRLAVGHVEYFNPAVQALLAEDGLEPGFVEIHRMAAFSPRSLDVDVVLDLMIHDLQILHALDDSEVREVRANGVHVLSERADIANARIELASGCVANLTASRVSAERVRKLRVFAPPTYYSIDYLNQQVQGVRLDESGPERRFLPFSLPVAPAESLALELAAFVAACRGEPAAVVDGHRARRALADAMTVAEAVAA